jgi:hypothetical protein
MGIHDKDLLADLRSGLEKGDFRLVHNADEWGERLDRAFPFELNRIRWDRVPDHHWLEPLPKLRGEHEAPEVFYARCAPRITEFVERNFARERIGLDDRAIWLGDSIDLALEVTPAAFLRNTTILLSYPQHSYLIPPDVGWCLNYTFEDVSYFGRSPN